MTSITLINVAHKAQKAGIEQDELLQLLRLISASPELQGLMELLSSLIDVFPVTHEISGLNSDHDAISPVLIQAEKTARRLLALKDEFKREGYTSFFTSLTRSRQDIFYRLLNKSPLYSCLGLLPLGDEENPGFRQLQAQLLLFSARHLGQDMGSHLNLFKAVRDLCNLRHQDELLQLPHEFQPSQIYFQQLAGSHAPRLKVIGELSQEAPQPYTPDASRAKKTTRSHPRKKSTNAPSKTSPTLKKALPKSRRTLLTKIEAQKYHVMGGHPDELQPSTEEIPIEVPEEILSGATFRNLCFWAKVESNRRAMENQRLPYAWKEASLYDLSVLIAFIQGRIELSVDMPVNIEVRSALFLSLFLSRSVKELAELPYLSADNIKPDTGEGLFTAGQGQLVVRLYAPGPELSEENRNRDWPAAYPVTRFSNVPLPGICPEIMAHLRPDGDEQRYSPFASANATLTAQTERVVRVLRRSHNCRLSPARISHYMINRLSCVEGMDLPKAALYFGLDLDLASTRVHYSTAHLPSMEQSYRLLCNRLCRQLEIDPAFAEDAPLVNQDIYLGSPFCPRPDAVKALVADMQERLADLKKNLNDDHKKILEYHNHYTLYTALQTAYASGYRAINERFFGPGELDPETGLAVISDKDTPDYYTTRQVWVHPRCREQLDHYQQHLLALFDRVGLSSEPLYALFRDKGWPDIVCDFVIFPQVSTKKLVNLTPSGLKTLLDENYDYDMPPNSNRHFLKNSLIDNQCPPEVVEAFLGHWHNGQEPWNSLSSLHPADYQRELKPHLTTVLDNCGWQSLPGLAS